MSCSCALQSRLIQGMLMMLSTWEGDSFGRCVFPCVCEGATELAYMRVCVRARKRNGGIISFVCLQASCLSRFLKRDEMMQY